MRYTGRAVMLMPTARLAFHGLLVFASAWLGGRVPSFAATTESRAEEALTWWSLRALAPVQPPSPAGLPEAWSSNPIDCFIFAGLAARGLTPSPPADRRSLIRRVTFDLLGLPPTPAEVDAFAQDASPGAYEALVERLLASPHYGEQWGRHWLDVVRFGESRGFERNEIIPNAWPFRDYVIRSFNADKPFDQLVVEHLAGDVIAHDQPEVEVGTAFLVAGPYDDVGNQDAVQARLIRANTIDDVIATTSTAFLGLTVQCARCHAHKFDPISQDDYYQLYSVFEGVHPGERPLDTPEKRAEREVLLQPLEGGRTRSDEALKAFEAEVLARTSAPPEASEAPGVLPAANPHLTEDRFSPVDARFVRMTIESNNRHPRDGGNVRIDEFEVWTGDGGAPRNVALAATGATIEAPTRRAEDFSEAYAPALMIDGVYGARWVSPGAGAITVTMPRVERIERVALSADRSRALPPDSGEIVFIGEYEIDVSIDGRNWKRVADSRARAPVNDTFRRERSLRRAMAAGDEKRRAELEAACEAARAAIALVPPRPQVWAGRFEQPKTTARVFQGGDPERPVRDVHPASLSTLALVTRGFSLPTDAPEGERRLALARWLVQPDNPLTPRVLANRVWQHHFGTGLVDTPGDFGRLGGEPTHPELLDWLASRLQQHGWRLKALHRDIVLSQTYRQSAAPRQEALVADAETRWLWRFPPRRLGAEELRDAMLCVAGVLDARGGGPGFRLYRYLQDNVATYLPLARHGPGTYRRAVYHQNARAMVVDLLTDFDLPDCAFVTPRRATTTSPLQALTLLNHSFTLDMASALALRAQRQAGSDDGPRPIEEVFRLALQRSVASDEAAESRAFVQRHGLAAFCRVILNSNEFLYLD